MGTRRVKTVDWDEHDDGWGAGDWGSGGWGWDEGYAAPKKAAAKPKAAAPKPKAKAATPAKDPVAAPKASLATEVAAPPAAPSGPSGTSSSSTARALVKEEDGRAEVPGGKTAAASAPGQATGAAEQEADEQTATVPLPDAVADDRPCINLVVVGHVDAGKSTLMGHLLCLVGNVSSKQLHKFEKESKQIGKASFAFAWVLDEGEDERQRGVTIDVCVKHFTTTCRRFTILDAPGHRDFVPNMVHGAVQADVALLVADTSHFEAGFDRGGQTKEHLQLVRSLGISSLVVVVNKLDTCGWSQEVYEDIKAKLHAYIVGPECGFKASNITYVPLSGFSGENLLERKEAGLRWWDGPTLIEALDQLPPPARQPASGPLRICISDLYKNGANTCLSGKVEAGTISVGQKVVLLPSGEQTTVKSLETRGARTRVGVAGDYMDSVMVPVEPQFACVGGAICDPAHPVPVSDTFQAQILVFDVDVPIMRGQQFMCYLHTETLTATLKRLDTLIVKGKPQDRRPKCLQKGNVAIVQLEVGRKVCLEPKPSDGSPATSLSRLVLRDRGRTVAAGLVLAVG